jgi:tRNA nucleotidyltransferase/poly(A) polymerase
LQDIAARQIRLVNPQALEQDPVRVLRAVRQGLAFDFRLTEETKTAVTAAAPLLHKTSTERIRDELVKLLETAVPHKAVGQMAALGLLPELLPEIAALASVEQSPPHHEPVLAHTIAVLEWVAALETAVLDQQPAADAPLKQAQTALRPFVDGLRTHFGRELDAGLNGRLLLHLDALFHDAGKLSTRTVDEEGRIRFLGHDKAGAEVAAVRLRALKFSRQAIKQVETAVAHHMRPFSLAQTGKPLSRRAIFRYFRAAGETGLDVGLLALADHLATYEGMGDTAVWEHLLAVVAELFRHYFHLFTETVAPEMLVNGRDLMEELNLPSGPEIGRLLRLVQEAQAAGSLHTRAEALAFARAARQ